MLFAASRKHNHIFLRMRSGKHHALQSWLLHDLLDDRAGRAGQQDLRSRRPRHRLPESLRLPRRQRPKVVPVFLADGVDIGTDPKNPNRRLYYFLNNS